jgi:hypothetical protein
VPAAVLRPVSSLDPVLRARTRVQLTRFRADGMTQESLGRYVDPTIELARTDSLARESDELFGKHGRRDSRPRTESSMVCAR